MYLNQKLIVIIKNYNTNEKNIDLTFLQNKIEKKINKDKIVRGKFYLKKGKSKFLKLRIAPSTIKNAGMGCFAVDPIPKGSKSSYRGLFRSENSNNIDHLYSWQICKFDKNGKTKYKSVIGYLDGSNDKYSNFNKYVNCGMKSKDNNMECEQRFMKIYYIALRDIKAGEELFIDYGEGYREDNLKMKGEY
jgi:SET domain-containing protein